MRPKTLSDSNLALLDAAPPSVITDTMQIKSQARMEQILAMPANPISATREKRSARVKALRWAAIPALAGLLIAANTLAPNSPGVAPAFASWNANPTALTGARLEAATNACTITFNDSGNPNAHTDAWERLTGTPIMAEQRGDWALLVFNQSYDALRQSAKCLVVFVANAPKVITTFGEAQLGNGINSLRFGLGSGEFNFFGDNSPAGASLSILDTWEAVTPTEGATLSAGFKSYLPENGEFTVIQGQVAADVTGLVIHTPNGTEVNATIVAGQFAAWWPDIVDNRGIDTFVDAMAAPVGVGRYISSITLILADGTELADQRIEVGAPALRTYRPN